MFNVYLLVYLLKIYLWLSRLNKKKLSRLNNKINLYIYLHFENQDIKFMFLF